MQDVLTIESIRKNGADGKFRAICASGNVYEVRYIADYGGAFFSDVPFYEEVIGFEPYEK